MDKYILNTDLASRIFFVIYWKRKIKSQKELCNLLYKPSRTSPQRASVNKALPPLIKEGLIAEEHSGRQKSYEVKMSPEILKRIIREEISDKQTIELLSYIANTNSARQEIGKEIYENKAIATSRVDNFLYKMQLCANGVVKLECLIGNSELRNVIKKKFKCKLKKDFDKKSFKKAIKQIDKQKIKEIGSKDRLFFMFCLLPKKILGSLAISVPF